LVENRLHHTLASTTQSYTWDLSVTDRAKALTAVEKALAKARMSPGAAAAAAALVSLAGMSAPAMAVAIVTQTPNVSSNVTSSNGTETFAYTITNNTGANIGEIVIPETAVGAFTIQPNGQGLPTG